MVLVDTAGIRRRGRVEPGVERASVRRAGAAVRRADVAAIVIDASQGITSQDQHIIGMAIEEGAGILLVMNKLDLIEPQEGMRDSRARQLAGRARFVPWAPIVWVSALTGAAIDSVIAAGLHVAEQRRFRASTPRLNSMVRQATIARPPATLRGRPVKFFYATQTGIEPPTFLFFLNHPEALHFSYERYLRRKLRETFGFDGAAIRLQFRGRDADSVDGRRR